MALLDRFAVKQVPINVAVFEREHQVVIRAQELNLEHQATLLSPLAFACLVQDQMLKPPVVRAPVISGVEVPV
jgi:hypothetical protein